MIWTLRLLECFLAGARTTGCSRDVIARVMVLSALLGTASGLAACHDDVQGPIVARVGGSAIHKVEVDHWANAITRGVTLGSALGLSHGGSSRQAALGFLISSKWLIGEAAANGAAVTERDVSRTLRERIGADGDELNRRLESTGQTIADEKLEIATELAAEAIRRILIRRASDITSGEVLAYYRRNVSRLGLGELRGVEIIEGLPSRAAAFALVRRIGTRASFAERAKHEFLELTPTTDSGKAAVLRAIFAARLGVISRPTRFNEQWTVFIVTRIVPPRLLPFARTRADAAALLIAERQRLVTAAYFKAYRSRWIARTSCRLGYVVQVCAQYTGVMRPERDPFSDAAADRPNLTPRPVRVAPPE